MTNTFELPWTGMVGTLLESAAMVFVVALVLFGSVLWGLRRLKQRGLEQCQAVLGFAPATDAPVASRRTPEGLAAVERVLLRGTLAGRPATLAERRVRSPQVARRDRRGSDFTVLAIALEPPARVALRIQPAGVLGAVEVLLRGAAEDRVAIDATFDQAYVVYSDAPAAAAAILTPAMRERLLAFRRQIAGDLPASVTGKLASGFLLGSFHVDGAAARYVVFGSPTKATAEHAKAAAPLLLELAAVAGARG